MDAMKENILRQFLLKYGNKSSQHKIVMNKVIQNFIKNNNITQQQLQKLQDTLDKDEGNSQINNLQIQSNNLPQVVHYMPTKSVTSQNARCSSHQDLKYLTQSNQDNLGVGQNKKQLVSPFLSAESTKANRTGLQLTVNKPEFLDRQLPFKQTTLKKKDHYSDDSIDSDKKSVYVVKNGIKVKQKINQKKSKMNGLLLEQKQTELLRQRKKIHLKDQLDQQMVQAARKKEQDKIEEESYFKVQQQMWQRQEEEDNRKQEVKRVRNLQLNGDRDYQVRSQMKMKLQEKKDEDHMKQYLNSQYQNDIQQEQDEKINRKKNKKDFLQKVMKQSEIDKQMANEIENDRILKDQTQFNKYGEFLDMLEQKRSHENNDRNSNVQRLLDRWDNITKLQKEKQGEEDRMFKQEAVEADQKFQEQMILKHQTKEKIKSETCKTLAQQIKTRQEQLAQLKNIDMVQGQIWKEDTERYFNEERQRAELIKTVHLQQKAIIFKQIDEKKRWQKAQSELQKMTVEELMQNKQTLKKINMELRNGNLQKIIV